MLDNRSKEISYDLVRLVLELESNSSDPEIYFSYLQHVQYRGYIYKLMLSQFMYDNLKNYKSKTFLINILQGFNFQMQ